MRRAGEVPPTWTGRLTLPPPHARTHRPEGAGEREADDDVQGDSTRRGRTLICDGGTEPDPLAVIREREAAIREHVVEGRDDDLAAWGRVLLALANDRQPDPADLRRLELPGDGQEHQSALYATVGGARLDASEVVQKVRRVLESATEAEKPDREP